MKKLIFILTLLLCTFAAKAEVQTYVGTSYAVADVSYGRYYWSQWYSCNVLIIINTDTNIITIGSNVPQVYGIYNYEGNTFDDGGGQQAVFDVIDNEGDYGKLRIRVIYDRYGNVKQSQIYIDFKNIAWVYNITSYY